MSKHAALDRFGRSGNPVFGNKFDASQTITDANTMSLNGAVNKTGILLALCFCSAIFTWNNPIPTLMWTGMIGGFIVAIYTSFVPKNAGITAPIYAILKGFALGAISVFFEREYPGIAIQAIGLTFGTLAALLFFYKSGIIKPTENFRLMIFSATAAVCILYIINLLMYAFGANQIGFIHDSGFFGIAFSLFVVSIAALNLVLDFDFIEQGSENGLPKYMEWYGAFALMVTLVWLYLEILRLLAKLRR